MGGMIIIVSDGEARNQAEAAASDPRDDSKTNPPSRSENKPIGWREVLDVMLPAVEVMGEAAVRQASWQPDAPGVYCWRCGATAGPGEVTSNGCSQCRDERIPWDHLWRLGAYEEPLNHWVCAMKFGRRWHWALWFGRALSERMAAAPDGGADFEQTTLVTWVPLHLTRRLRRGFDQAGLMAGSFAKQSGRLRLATLRRARRTAAQSTLRAHAARQRNVRDAFKPRRIDLTGWRVILLDDVKTSGATLAQCARLLRDLGAARIDVAVAAVADPHMGHGRFVQDDRG